jgi:hypothetical protein
VRIDGTPGGTKSQKEKEMIFDTNFSEERTIVQSNYDGIALVDCALCACSCSCTCTCPCDTVASNKSGNSVDNDKSNYPYDNSATANKG